MKFNKQKGAVDSFLYAIATIMIIFVFLIGILPCFNMLQVRTQINQIARKYLLKMEEKGCLSSNDKRGLEEEILAINGITSVELSADCTYPNEVGYGDFVTLSFEAEYNYNNYRESGFSVFSPVMEKKTETIVYRKQTTSKH